MAKSLSVPLKYCSKERKPCIVWVERYFKDCLCNRSDEISFALGIVSLVCWGVAEIPQIITNYHTQSGHGVSLTFLLTWVVGDIFNLAGCLLEPATLPTQFYTALLYTASTVVLVLQIVYYDHICRRWKCMRTRKESMNGEGSKSKYLLANMQDSRRSSSPISTSTVNSSRGTDACLISARSLARSNTPTRGSSSYLGHPKSGPSAFLLHDSSSEDDNFDPTYSKPSSQPIRIPRPTQYGTFLATCVSLPFQSKAFMDGYVEQTGMKLLQQAGMASSVYGIWFGWMMAAIYMGGRIPQICLNIKRGSVEGLNPLMFIFALIANATYVGSILVRSLEWEKLKANMPWLLDALVCVALDLFIIIQYIYYMYVHRHKDGSEDYEKAKQAPLSS